MTTSNQQNHVRATDEGNESFVRQAATRATGIDRRERENFESRLQDDYERFLIHCAEFGISPPASIREYQRMV